MYIPRLLNDRLKYDIYDLINPKKNSLMKKFNLFKNMMNWFV